MILISGSSEREIVDLQQGDYEEMDQLAIAKPLCKAAFRVLHAADIGIGLARAIRAAVSGRPGGVYLDLPAKLFGQVMDAEAGTEVAGQGDRRGAGADPGAGRDQARARYAQMRQAAADHSRQGCGLCAGRRCDQELVEKSGIPFLPMSMAKGLLPDTHPQCAGAARSTVLKESDVVMLIGARLNWLLSHGKGKTWGERTEEIHPDRHRAEGNGSATSRSRPRGRRHRFVRRRALSGAWAPTGLRRPPTGSRPSTSKRDENVAKMAPRLMNNNSPMDYHGALGVLAHHRQRAAGRDPRQ